MKRQIAILSGLVLTAILIGRAGAQTQKAFVKTQATDFLATTIPPTSGTSISQLQIEANRISASIATANTQANLIGLRYLAAMQNIHHIKQKLSSLSVDITRYSKLVSHTQKKLYEIAVSDYTSSGNSNTFLLLLSGNFDQANITNVYLKIAANRLSTEENIFQIQKRRLNTDRDEEKYNLSLAAINLSRVKRDRSEVLAELNSEHHLLSGIKGHLVQLVAIQTAAKERAQMALIRLQEEKLLRQQLAAERKTANHKSATPQTSSTSPPAKTPVVTTATPATAPPSINPTLAQDFAGIRNCESGGVYTLNTGNGYYGAYQFSLPTWSGLGEPGLPNQSPPPTQDAAAYKLYQQSGWTPWPACAASLGLP